MSRAGNGRAVVSDTEARDLMARYDSGTATLTALAGEVGVTPSALSQRFTRIRKKDKAAEIPPNVREELEAMKKQIALLEATVRLLERKDAAESADTM